MRKTLYILTMLIFGVFALASNVIGQEVKYDRFEDTSEVTTKIIGIEKSSVSAYGKSIIKGDASKGKFDGKNIQAIYLSFTSFSSNFLFRSNYKVKAIIDDERLDFSSVEWSGKVVDLGITRPILLSKERVDIKITPDELKKLANAKSAEIRVGTVEIVLNTKAQDELKKLISFLENPKQ